METKGNFFQQFYELNSGQYLIWYVLGAILLALLLKNWLSRFFARLLVKLFNRKNKRIDEKAVYGLVAGPIGAFLTLLVVVISLEKIALPPTMAQMPVYAGVTLVQVVRALGVIIIIGSFIWLLLRLIDFIAILLEEKANLTATQGDNQLIVFFKDFFKVILVIIGFLLILRFAFGQRIGNLLTGLSIVGAAIALATKESLENLIASFIIFFDKPFTTGDLVKVQHITGVVERIGLRSTRIRTDNKTYVSVPNKQMVDSIVDNHSLRTHRRHYELLQLEPDTTTEKLEALIAGIKNLLSKREEIEEYSVYFSGIEKGLVEVPVEYLTAHIPYSDFIKLSNEINFKILGLLNEHGVKVGKLV
jgi:MscS family membrane protein